MRKWNFMSKRSRNSRLSKFENCKVENKGIWIPREYILKKYESECNLEDSAIKNKEKELQIMHSSRRHIYDDILFIIDYHSDKEFKTHIDSLVEEAEHRNT